MNRQLKKNSSKRIASIIGIASISALFSLPILAITNPSSSQLLAQTQPESDSSPTPRVDTEDRSMPSDVTTPTNNSAPEVAPSETTTPQTVPSLPEKTTTENMPEPIADTSLKPGNYWCMNNPNPQCRG
ncbi:MAG: hypothetical protein WBG73_00995 [Coleofasciculaceae cyanobacterium]